MKYLAIIVLLILLTACTQESQNKFSRSIQNWTGTDGVLDIYMGEKLVKRFIKIDKLSTAQSTSVIQLVIIDMAMACWTAIKI